MAGKLVSVRFSASRDSKNIIHLFLFCKYCLNAHLCHLRSKIQKAKNNHFKIPNLKFDRF